MDNLLDLKRVRKIMSGEESDGNPQEMRSSGGPHKIRASTFLKIAFLVVAATVIIVAVFGFIQSRNTWRAVFLANNQVYFGHFSYIPFRSTATLTDIYYLQVSQPLQPQRENQNSPEMKIIKFGNEIHGPKDKMVIPKSQILFWEDLRDDGPVVKAIREDKAK